jgi:hypothetical protein
MRSFSSSEMRTVTTDKHAGLSDLTLRFAFFFLQFLLTAAITGLHEHCNDLYEVSAENAVPMTQGPTRMEKAIAAPDW